MMRDDRRPRRVAGRTLLVLGLGVGGVAGCRSTEPVPDEREVAPEAVATLTPEQYRALVSAFYTGVTAYQVGDNERARAQLERSTTLAPGEAATWANHALAEARAGDVAAADAAIARARALEPEDAGIMLLAAQIEGRQGDAEGAIALLRDAVARDGSNLKARYALVEELNRSAGADGDAATTAAIGEQLDAIVAASPGNLVALIERGRLAARDGDVATVESVLGELAGVADGWDDDTRAKLADLRARAAGGEAPPATEFVILRNLLLVTPPYQADLAELKPAEDAIGEPLERFYTLPSPAAEPAAADGAIAFDDATEGGGSVAWAAALDLVPPGPPLVVRLDSAAQAVAVGDAVSLPFPLLRPDGVTDSPGVVVPIDWNNDHRPDLVLAGECGLWLYQQFEPGAWADVTPAAGLGPDVTGGCYTGAWALDIDLEGDLDLVLGAGDAVPVVLRNNGDGTWAVVDAPFEPVGVRQLVWGDLDADADPDVALVASDDTLHIYANERSGRYRRLGRATAAETEPGGAFAAITLGDPDMDGRLDVVALDAAGGIGRVALTPGEPWEWDVLPLVDGAPVPRDGSARLFWGDLDNNGAADLVASGSGGSQVWLAGPDGALEPLAAGDHPGRVTAVADLDGDGRLDMTALHDGAVVRRINRPGAHTYHWQVVRPRALVETDQRNNAFGVGGEMMIRAGLLAQLQPMTGPTMHFGLGDYPAADLVLIRWPNGIVQGEFELGVDQAVSAEQRLKGSCPWLFADNGSVVAFVTDILWKSPLGLRINAQDTAGVVGTRDWVNVRGDQLAARDGRYDLRITAELWETHYFDHVALMTVDHPVGTEVFVDERFSVPLPPPAVHVTTPPEPVLAARDQDGVEVGDIVRDRDARYLDTFGLGRFQGVASDHFVELEIPAVTDATVVVAQGWVYPTDSSINVAIGQGAHDPPRDLALEVPDGSGGWRVAREHLGFPAGKHKTMLIDLAGVVPAGSAPPYRVRLRTNMEVYWDRLAVAERLPMVDVVTRTLLPDVADLRYRGFSATNYTRSGQGRPYPEVPHYAMIAGTRPMWSDLVGFYTRFGDVRPLLERVDDRYAILNAGDEIALSFPAPPPPSDGWTRDFVFVSDGWEKDGDFNTAYSETVLPLPSHDRPEYAEPRESGSVGRLQDDPVYRRHPDDWVTYHTRYVTNVPLAKLAWPAPLPGGAEGGAAGGDR